MNGWTDGWTYAQIPTVFYRTSSPFGDRCPKTMIWILFWKRKTVLLLHMYQIFIFLLGHLPLYLLFYGKPFQCAPYTTILLILTPCINLVAQFMQLRVCFWTWTEWQTDQQKDQQMDWSSYQDARTHLTRSDTIHGRNSRVLLGRGRENAKKKQNKTKQTKKNCV